MGTEFTGSFLARVEAGTEHHLVDWAGAWLLEEKVAGGQLGFEAAWILAGVGGLEDWNSAWAWFGCWNVRLLEWQDLLSFEPRLS